MPNDRGDIRYNPADLVEPTVQYLVDEIAGLRDDPGTQHACEDTLYLLVLRACAAGNPEAQKLATIALRTQHIEFRRRCA